MSFRPRPGHPYAAAPRFPDGERVGVEELFPRRPAGPFEIEIGPGRGSFALERCATRADVTLLGLEIRLKWASIVDARLGKLGLHDRARVLCADAREALPRLQPDASVAVFYLHFPDPWWKKRHEKRLVLSPMLLDAMCRLLVGGGEIFVQTDVEERAAMYEAQLGAHPALESSGNAPGSPDLVDNPYGARSPRERRAITDGLPVHRLRYRRSRV